MPYLNGKYFKPERRPWNQGHAEAHMRIWFFERQGLLRFARNAPPLQIGDWVTYLRIESNGDVRVVSGEIIRKNKRYTIQSKKENRIYVVSEKNLRLYLLDYVITPELAPLNSEGIDLQRSEPLPTGEEKAVINMS